MADHLPSIDVVIATRDRPELLRKAVEAAWAQTYEGDVQIIVVFDRTEPDISLARSSDRRVIRVISNVRSAGLAGARNSGIEAGSGDYVAFCDDDDEWRPDKLKAQVRAVQASRAPTCVTGITVRYDDHDTDRVPVAGDMTLENLARNRVMAAHPSTVLVERTALVERIGLVDEEIPGSYGEDFDWILRAAAVGPIDVVDQPLVLVRWGQSLFSQRWETIVAAIDYGVAKHEVFRQDGRALARLYGRRAFALAALGRRREALGTARRAFMASPSERRSYLAVAVALRMISAQRLMDIAHRRGHGI